jgi:hypothetical protein
MATRAHSSTDASADTPTGSTVRSHSGQGRTASNLLMFAAAMLIMIGSFWAFASYPDSPLIWVLGLLLYGLALLLPVGLLRSSTTKKVEGGRSLAMDVPPSTEVGGIARVAEQFDDGPQDARVRDAEVTGAHKDDKLGKAVQ